MTKVYLVCLVVILLSLEGLAFNHYIAIDKVIYYNVDESFSQTEKDYIKSTIKEITSRSCLEWKLHDPHYKDIPVWIDLVPVDNSEGCTTMSRPENATTIALSPSCFQEGWVLHELLHALGFEHEHRRPDRDCYVEVHSSKWESQTYSIMKELDITIPYDIKSVMHFRRNSYLRPAQDYPEQNVEFGSKDVLSNKDAWTLNTEFCGGPKYCDNNERECDEVTKSIQDRGCIHNP